MYVIFPWSFSIFKFLYHFFKIFSFKFINFIIILAITVAVLRSIVRNILQGFINKMQICRFQVGSYTFPDSLKSWFKYFRVYKCSFTTCQRYKCPWYRFPHWKTFYCPCLFLLWPTVVSTLFYPGMVSYLTLKRLMSYTYGAPILDVSRSHTTMQHSR